MDIMGAESLTWALFDTEGSISVLGCWVLLQLEGVGVVDQRLRALGHTCPAVIEISAGLQGQHTTKHLNGPINTIQQLQLEGTVKMSI